ncbi:MAG TPA: hypothetical protein VE911_04125 [Candidatus Nitrosopolaris sp.]|nr:hypothetical protein [Candidatus Nitrosopolaris sp.]
MLQTRLPGKVGAPEADPQEGSRSYLYLRLFPADGPEGIVRLIDAIRARKPCFVRQWHALCASSLRHTETLSEEVFQTVYVPTLRSGIECLIRGLGHITRQLGTSSACLDAVVPA